jgi:hypothetical protein
MDMIAFVIIVLLLVLGPLALVYGADSRRYDERPRGSIAGARRLR